MRSLSEMFNVNYFLVSQTNPHIVPALNLKKRVNRKLGNLLEAEWKHRCAMPAWLYQSCIYSAGLLHTHVERHGVGEMRLLQAASKTGAVAGMSMCPQQGRLFELACAEDLPCTPKQFAAWQELVVLHCCGIWYVTFCLGVPAW